MHRARPTCLDYLGALRDWRRAVDEADLLCHRNACPEFLREVRRRDYRAFHVIRDPRDMLVSGYYSHLYSHRPTPVVARQRRILQECSLEEGLLRELDFFAVHFERLSSWSYEEPEILEIRFEDLVESPTSVWQGILRHIQLNVPSEILKEILFQESFQTVTGRERGQEDKNHKYRKGIPGDWKLHFTPKIESRFNGLYGKLLAKLGYVGDGGLCQRQAVG